MKTLLFALMLLGSVKSYSQDTTNIFKGTVPFISYGGANMIQGVWYHRIDTVPVLINIVIDFDKPKVKWVSGYAVIHSTPNMMYYDDQYKTKVFLADKKTEATNVLNWIRKPKP